MHARGCGGLTGYFRGNTRRRALLTPPTSNRLVAHRHRKVGEPGRPDPPLTTLLLPVGMDRDLHWPAAAPRTVLDLTPATGLGKGRPAVLTVTSPLLELVGQDEAFSLPRRPLRRPLTRRPLRVLPKDLDGCAVRAVLVTELFAPLSATLPMADVYAVVVLPALLTTLVAFLPSPTLLKACLSPIARPKVPPRACRGSSFSYGSKHGVGSRF